ncbi:SLC13 family permease [Staphylococcus massiliensis]|uniref:Sodium-dependent dicarboxylate transporter SdcS n=1 Tax=Staphylococcus massiliensis S46 TaxID=1229783 RepID=K9AHX4_9STAP|nr:SLC13 family permease [Staphylococcus massiliensis]EKU46864.1 sodium:sulfate symporter [Staphylococcus massiliensis S46]MCG3399921.1 SLC13 family permease [Staphylococcus massiliensis]MCG3402640.1 SLC13 family permease [Staphylococcus massiliensis]MCG3412887.1 SLC13 family permease [Staphylococcus massiliensis]PNZ98100.1 C4-dicarboxylate ABC transporter [Staphylococcus massiliensis CCUG 55927]
MGNEKLGRHAYLTFFSKQHDDKPSYTKAQLIGLLLGPILFTLILTLFKPEGLSSQGVFVLAITAWIASWWITEAIPIAATSLLPIVLLPLGHVMDSKVVASQYGNDIIFLFLGGFILAIAMERWNLHTRVALNIINAIGTSTGRILLGFMFATGFLSMFVSNTAAVMIMIPIGLAIIKEARALKDDSVHEKSLSKFERALVLAIGYAGTIGGLGTLIGTPPLIILKGQYHASFGEELSFARWMIIGIPTVIVLLTLAWLYLKHVAYKHDMKDLPGGKKIIQDKLHELGQMQYEEKVVQAVFILASLLWISREFLLKNWSVTSQVADGTIAMFIAILLFLIPAKNKSKHTRIVDWSIAKDLPWGVLILFGGGLALAKGIQESGLAKWLGEQLSLLNGVSPLIIVIVIAVFVLFLTEITSNTATATMILPILATLSVAINVHPLLLMVPAAMASNCAFMLPVGTPPNAIAFGTGKLSIKEMATTGFWLNLISAVLLVLVVYFILPPVLGIDIMKPLPLK